MATQRAQIRFCVTFALSAPGRPSTWKKSIPVAVLGIVWLLHPSPADAFPTSSAPTTAVRPYGKVACV